MNPDATIQAPLEPALEAWWAAEPELPTASVDLLHEESYLLSHEGELVIEPLATETFENTVEDLQADNTSDETLRPVVAGRRAKTIVAALAGLSAFLGPQIDEAKDIWRSTETVAASVEESAYQIPPTIEAPQDSWVAAKFITAVESMPLSSEEGSLNSATFEAKQTTFFTEAVELQPQMIEAEMAPIETIELATVSLPFELLPSDPETDTVITAGQVIEREPAMIEETTVEQEYSADIDEMVVAEDDEGPTYPTILEPIDRPELDNPVMNEGPDKENTGGLGEAILAVSLLAVYAASFFRRAIATRPRKEAAPSKPAVQPMPVLKPASSEAAFVAPTIAVEEVVPKPRNEIASHRKQYQKPRHTQKPERRELTKAGVVRRSTGWLPQWLRGPVVAPSVPLRPAVQQSAPMPVVMSQGMPLAVAPPPPVPPPFMMPTPDK